MERSTTNLKVISYNIHKGFSSNNRRFILGKIRDAIREVHADIILLQEVLGHHTEHGKHIEEVSQFEYLAHEIWPHYAYGKNAVYELGHHGNAILSKFPFSVWENIDISSSQLERRGLLHGAVHIPGLQKPLHLISTHLSLREKDRRRQLEFLSSRINSHVDRSEPLIIGGDFNDWRVKITKPLETELNLRETYSTLHGSHAKTFPSWLPTLRLDRLYYRGLQVLKSERLQGPPWNRLSDHIALYAELAFAED